MSMLSDWGHNLFSGDQLEPGSYSSSSLRLTQRPNLLLLVDRRGWAFDNIAAQVKKYLSDRYEIRVVYVVDHGDLAFLLKAILFDGPVDMVHVFWRPILDDLLQTTVFKRTARFVGLTPKDVIAALAKITLTSTVYDHLSLEPAAVTRLASALSVLDGYAISSPKLDAIYRALPGVTAPTAILADGVDLSLYKPRNFERLTRTGRSLVVGWVGNSRWGLLEGHGDVKGLATIIRPALKLLEARGIEVEERIIDAAERERTRDEVAEYFGTIDIYVCASLFEGTPNPVLEAMASGVAIVSTDVGIVDMVFGPLQKEFLVERTPEAVCNALERLAGDPTVRNQLSRENLTQIQMQEWSKRMPLWADFFRVASERAATASLANRIEALTNVAAAPPRTYKHKIRATLRRYPAVYAAVARTLHWSIRMRSRLASGRNQPRA